MEFTGKHSNISAVSLKVGWSSQFFAFSRGATPSLGLHPLSCLVGKILPESFLPEPLTQTHNPNPPLQELFWQHRTPSLQPWGALSPSTGGPGTAPCSEASGKGCCSLLQPGLAFWEMLFLGLCDHPSHPFEVLNAAPVMLPSLLGTSGGPVAQIPFPWVCLLQRKAILRACQQLCM